MIFEAKTLEEVYTQASEHFNVSISKLELNIIQYPSKGIFGFFSKQAIIDVVPPMEENKIESSNIKTDTISTDSTEIKQTNTEKPKVVFEDENVEIMHIDDVVKLAKEEVNKLFELSCFDIENIEVTKYNDETILFEINGNDAALLIGKEGYRYNALSTMLFSWISQKYGYKTRLEIASFLKNQEEMMNKFLEPTIKEIEEKGRCKTRPFDGVLVYIAVDILRKYFPDKYVAIKKNRFGDSYIIVNEFLNKNE